TRSLRDWSSDVCSSDLTYHLEGFPLTPTLLRFSPDGRLLAAISRKTLKVLDVETGAVVHRDDLPNRHYQSAAFSPDGRLLAAAEIGRASCRERMGIEVG